MGDIGGERERIEVLPQRTPAERPPGPTKPAEPERRPEPAK
jgi:hypothetical protein